MFEEVGWQHLTNLADSLAVALSFGFDLGI